MIALKIWRKPKNEEEKETPKEIKMQNYTAIVDEIQDDDDVDERINKDESFVISENDQSEAGYINSELTVLEIMLKKAYAINGKDDCFVPDKNDYKYNYFNIMR